MAPCQLCTASVTSASPTCCASCSPQTLPAHSRPLHGLLGLEDYLDALQVIRDLCSWSGLTQVSKKTFLRALEDRGSVMLVPGGQAELVHTWKAHLKRPQYVVYTRHKGGPRLRVWGPSWHKLPGGYSLGRRPS